MQPYSKAAQCAAVVTVVLAGLFLGMARAGPPIPHVVEAFIGAADATAANPANAASGTWYMLEDPLAPSVPATHTSSDGVVPAHFGDDVGSAWDPAGTAAYVGNTSLLVVETVDGVAGWTGANYTTSTDGVMTSANQQELAAVNMDAYPALARTTGMDFVDLTWTGITDAAGNVVDYYVYRGVTNVATVPHTGGGGPHGFNDTPLAPGTYCYQISAVYRINNFGGRYETAGRSAPICGTVGGVGPVPPEVTVTSPSGTTVALTANVVGTFSEAMNTATVTVDSVPATVFALSWNSPTNTIVTAGHAADFIDCEPYTVWINGSDANDGLALVPGAVPNPFTFTTTCIAPTLQAQAPTGGNVALNTPITATFSEAMNTATTVEIWPPVTLVLSWNSPTNTMVTATHATDFTECTTYTVWTNGTDVDGNAIAPGAVNSPWTFNTVCPLPSILSTTPPDNAIDVPVGTTVVIVFSETMINGTCTFVFAPSITFTVGWNGANDTATLAPDAPLAPATSYQVTVSGCQDLSGNGLIPGAPNPFDFTTETFTRPIVSVITPAGGEVWSGNSDHVVSWSQADDQSTTLLTLYVNYTYTGGSGTITSIMPPGPGGAVGSFTWTVPCLNVTDAQVLITAIDGDGERRDDVPSNTFAIDCADPTVTASSPTGTAVTLTADVRLTFSEIMDNTSTRAAISISPAVTLTWGLDVDGVTQVGTHAIPFTANTTYTVTVAVTALDMSDPGNGLAAVHMFSFTTVNHIPRAPTGLAAANVTDTGLILSWTAPTTFTNGDPIAGAITYTVYRGTSSTGPWGTGVTTTSTSLAQSGLSASTTYYFYITATVGGQTSADSTVFSQTTAQTPPLPTDNTLLIVGALLAILVVGGLLAFLFMRKKKKPEEEAPKPEEGAAPPPPEGEAPPPPAEGEEPPTEESAPPPEGEKPPEGA